MILRFALVVLGLLLAAHFVPGISLGGLYPAIIVALLLGVANITIRPLLTLLTLPVHFLTFGLSSFLINAGIFYFIGTFVKGFEVAGFIPALIGSLIVALISAFSSLIK